MLEQTILNRDKLDKLTIRERAVLRCLLQNPYATNAELGVILGKSDRTVDNQLRTAYAKLLPKVADDVIKRMAIVRELTLDDLA